MMDHIESRLESIKNNRDSRLANKYNYIPFKDAFPELSKALPGLFPGTMYKLLSYTSIGKSTLARYMTIIYPYIMYKNYGIKFHTIYFALEESREDFIDNMICFIMHKIYNISIDKMQLNSYSNDVMSKDTFDKINLSKSYVEDILKHVDIVDYKVHPTPMYKHCYEVSERLGTHYMVKKSTGVKIKKSDYDSLSENEKSEYNYSEYIQNDPELNVIVVCDQLNNIAEEKYEGRLLSQIDSMKKWSMNYCRLHMTKHWKWIIFNVQQLAFAGEGLESKKYNDLKPSLDKAGGSKELIRDFEKK
jgi:hypothetical protein